MEASRTDNRNQLIGSMLLIGVGIMAAVDEILFHQLLNWHHFYDQSTSDVALFSDGLLHAAELVAIVAGFFLYADIRGRHTFPPAYAWGWLLVGAGGFQIFDGIVDHKLLRLHQVRYGVDILPYDIAWNVFGAALIAIGILLIKRHGASGRQKS